MAAWTRDIEKGRSIQDVSSSMSALEEGATPTVLKAATSQTLTTASKSSGLSSKYSFTKNRTAPKARKCWSGINVRHDLRFNHPPAARCNRIVRKIHEQPRGYRKLATFLDCDENFMIYRRFGYLQSRLLLEKQDDLARLELELDVMEDREVRISAKSLMTRKHLTGERIQEKTALFKDIERVWNEYCILMTNASKMVALNKPTAVEHQSVFQWMDNMKPLVAPEGHFIRHGEDLITLRPGREHAWLDSTIERLLKWSPSLPVTRLFQSQDTREKTDGSDGALLYTRSRIEKCVVSIITFIILVLLIVPSYILYRLTAYSSGKVSLKCICVLLLATLAFSICVSLLTRARRHEILAASAAYCAVLVVFIGNIGNHGDA